MSARRPLHIVDATVAIKWFFADEEHSSESDAILLAFQQGRIDLLAPDHLYHEVINALRTGVRMKRLTVETARTSMQDFLSLAIPTVTGPNLFEQGFEFASEVRRHLGVGASDKIAFVLDEDGVRLKPATRTLESLYGSVPPLPGGESLDFEDQIEEAMDEEADRIARGLERR